jgi:hypothetical protein
MRTKGKLAIGAALILAVMGGAYTGHRLSERQIEWTWGLRTPNGPPGFALHFNERAWAWLSGGPPSALANTIFTARTDTWLTAIIEHGLREAPDGCPGCWLLAQVRALSDQGVFVSGYCAAEDELEKARGSTYAHSAL